MERKVGTMMKHFKKKGLAMLLALTMVCSALPVSALADEVDVAIDTVSIDDTTSNDTVAEESASEGTASDVVSDNSESSEEVVDDSTGADDTVADDPKDAATDDSADNTTGGTENDTADDEDSEELTPEEFAAKQAAEDEAARLAELLAASPEIVSEYTHNDVTVHVSAPEGAFPGGTSVEIVPVVQVNELVDAIDTVDQAKDVVAFDITFYDINGNEIQPRDGFTVSVSFELAAASELSQDDASLQVYHVDDAQNATPVGDEIPSSSDGVEINVEAESFSVYAVTVTHTKTGFDAEFYLLKKINVIPLENGSTQYAAKDYTDKDLTNMVGVVSGTAFVALGDQIDVTELNIADVFEPVQNAIEKTPDSDYLDDLKENILTSNDITGDFDNYGILWYVVKIAAGTYHVDGVVYDKTANFKALAYDANTTDSVTVPDKMAYPLGTKVTVADKVSRSGYEFTGWNTQADGNGVAYAAGSELELVDHTTLYAQWKKTTNTKVNFYIQLNNEVMDSEGNIKPRPVEKFSGSVAASTMSDRVLTSFSYADKAGNAVTANGVIRASYLGKTDFIQDPPTDADVFDRLKNDTKTKQHYTAEQLAKLSSENYDIYWYVVKYHNDGWHVDGILKEKMNDDGSNPPTTPGGSEETPGTPGGDGTSGSGGTPSTPGGGGTSGGGTPTTPGGNTPQTDIPEDDVPLTDHPSETEDIPEDDVPLTDLPDETEDIPDDDVPLSDLPCEVTDIPDDDVPLTDLPGEAEDIPEDDIPLADNPATGDNTFIWLLAAMVSGLGLVITVRKRKNGSAK